jgi:superfamily I DNA/RNA helicase/RecB family exonuclease
MPVEASTFHSLALRLVEHKSPGDRPIPLTTPEQVGLVASLLSDEDPDSWPITYRGILKSRGFAAEIADFLMRCSERLLSPDDLRARVKERADWRGIPGLFQRYRTNLADSGRTDYGTLLVSAVDFLGTQQGQDIASQYHFVYVDEYQDTSPAQAEMARLLAQPTNNLTVAGDPYQSIYSFRGAELRNVESFTQEHSDARRIVLGHSFRVPAQIIGSALRVVAGGELPGAAGPVTPAEHQGSVETYIFDQETAEAEWIAREVEHLVRARGFDPSSIAILVRSKRELLNELSRSLERRSIPHDPPDGRLVDHPAIRLVNDVVTVALAGGDLMSAPPGQAAEANRAMRRILLGPSVSLGLGQERDVLRFRIQSLESWADVIRTQLSDHGSLADLVADSDWATTQSAADGFWHIWSVLPGLAEAALNDDRSDWRRALTAFSQVLQRQYDRDPNLSLAEYFDLVDEEGFEATPLLSYKADAPRVTLTTLHQAKGLEFDAVFIANAVEGVFPDLRRSRRMLRPELLSPERATDVSAQHLFQIQEEMRLAYTAMTRARLRVVWTATEAGVDQGEFRPSRFLLAASGKTSLNELGSPSDAEREPVTLLEGESMLRRALLDPSELQPRRLAAASILGSPPEAWWRAESFPGVTEPGPDTPVLGDTFTLSPSQADSYARCPRRYVLERRLRLSGTSSPYAHFGSLVHKALEDSESEVVGTDESHASLESALDHLNRVWEDASFGSQELDAAWLEQGVAALTHLYENWPTPDAKPIGLEEKVQATVEGVVWNGVVDRIEESDTGIRIVDYKTSKSPPAVEPTKSSVQLGFYASALPITSDKEIIEASMWFPRATGKKVVQRSLDLDRMDDIKAEMARITAAIRDERWDPEPSDDCKRCDFRNSCPAWPEGRGAYLP